MVLNLSSTKSERAKIHSALSNKAVWTGNRRNIRHTGNANPMHQAIRTQNNVPMQQ